MIGDEGSGYWIGIELLRAVSLFFDERLQRSKLIDRAVTELQLTDPRELPRFIANRGRPYVASLSAWVEEAAATGDELAVTICENAANSLYELVRAVVSTEYIPPAE